MRRLILFFAVTICTAAVAAADQRMQGRPAQIISGNELLLITRDGSHHRILLLGVGIPQPRQKWSAAAGRHLRMLVMGKPVEFRYPPQRSSGRLAGRLLHAGRDINRRLLAAGLARFDPAPALSAEIADDYRAAEREARQRGAGIWRDNSAPPPRGVQGPSDMRQHSERRSPTH